MTERIYYDGFERVEARNASGDAGALARWINRDEPPLVMGTTQPQFIRGVGMVDVGQWLIKHHDGRITVQDDEPVYVDHQTRILTKDCYDPYCEWCVQDKRYYVLSNGVMIPKED